MLKCDMKYVFQIYDAVLPQVDQHLDQRKQERAEEGIKFELKEAFLKEPLMVSSYSDYFAGGILFEVRWLKAKFLHAASISIEYFIVKNKILVSFGKKMKYILMRF